MKRKIVASGIMLIAFGLASGASASTLFVTTLTGNQEVPPTGSPATGSETALLNDAMTQLDVNLAFSGLEFSTTMAHIHCCAAPGVSAGVVLPFTGFPTGVLSGTYSHTFTLATDLTGITPSAFISALFAGTTYSNIHTTQFPSGEIRGQLTAVPEPGTAALFLLALLGALAVAARSRGWRTRSGPLRAN